jgi:hypothetical protein
VRVPVDCSGIDLADLIWSSVLDCEDRAVRSDRVLDIAENFVGSNPEPRAHWQFCIDKEVDTSSSPTSVHFRSMVHLDIWSSFSIKLSYRDF